MVSSTAGFLMTTAALAAVLASAPGPARALEHDSAGCRQLVLVVVPDWGSSGGRLTRFTRDATAWQRVGDPIDVAIGRSGCGWGLGLHPPQTDGPVKREGDGRSPAGIFTVGLAFGAADRLETGLEYRQMSAHDWCIDVPASPRYNTIVDDREVGADAVRGSTEPMRRDLHLGDSFYDLGFVIGHNCGCEAGAGSCIFAHLWSRHGAATAGCTAMADGDLRGLLAWLRADAEPRFVLLPDAEHRRLADAWDLPPPGAVP
jgi:L,D-peptidoglycan transpeptidase YkuD (ErfK/YbiS/YcfS/YnhG family)